MIFEATPTIDAAGLGINLQPMAVRELAALGFEEQLSRIASPIERLTYYNRHGQEVWTERRGRASHYRWPQYAVHRGALQKLLLEEVCLRLGAGCVKTGHAFTGFEQDGSRVTAHFAERRDGAPSTTVSGDILIGADGLHSTLRRGIYANEPLRFSGQMMWRGSTVASPFLDGHTIIMAGHRNHKFLAYPMGQVGDGNVLVNWIAELGTRGGPELPEEWDRVADRDTFAGHFADWRFSFLDIPSLIEAAQTVLEFSKVDRDPVPQWTFGRMTLLGDAAHPMQPTGGQAGSQAIMDARCLAFHLARNRDDPALALRCYEDERLPRMHAVALENRAMGSEAMMDIVEERAPNGFERISDVLPLAERETMAAAYRQLSGLNVELVNNGSPYSVA